MPTINHVRKGDIDNKPSYLADKRKLAVNLLSHKKRISNVVKFHTLGCKVNQYETQAIREACLNRGFKEAKSAKADCYVINTCTVTNAADRKSRECIYRCIRENPNAKVVVTGCYAQKDAGEISSISGVDLIIPNEQKNSIADILFSKKIKSYSGSGKEYSDLEISGFSDHDKAFVKIQDGCNNHCSYCKIPLVRGKSRSRGLESIVREADRLKMVSKRLS